MVAPHVGRHTAIPISSFSKINTNYDEDEPLPKPKRRWWDQARCKNLPVRVRNEVFFPSDGGFDIYKTAKLYCKNCPVKDECLESAIHEEAGTGRRQMIGMRGGKTPSQRYEIFKQWRAEGRIKKRSNSEAIKRLGRIEFHSNILQREIKARKQLNEQH